MGFPFNPGFTVSITPQPQLGVHFINPDYFLKAQAVANVISVYTGAISGFNSTSSSFFGQINNQGLYDDSNWGAGTYKTILTETNPVLVSNWIGPTAGAGAETHTVEFNVEGSVTEIAMTMASGQRMVLGGVAYNNIYTTVNAVLAGSNSITAAKDSIVLASGGIVSWSEIRRVGMPCLLSSGGVTIRAKTSAAITATGSVERMAALQYMVVT